jgi:hypothetical protein
MHHISCESSRGDESISELDGMSPAERIVARLLNLVVRLWCLPVLLLVWLLVGSAIVAIRLACPMRGMARSVDGDLLRGRALPRVWELSAVLPLAQDNAVL